MNLADVAQVVTVHVVGTGPPRVRTVTVGGRRRDAIDVAALFGMTSDENFGLTVACDAWCTAALVMWDGNFQAPNASPGMLDCVAR